MLLTAKLNETAQIMLWEKILHTCERVQNSMSTTGSKKSLFEIIYREKPNIIGPLLEFGRIAYITKREKIKRHTKDKIYKSIMVGYTDNHTRVTYKMYNSEKIITRSYIKWD